MKILALTGARSDYDLLSPLFRLLHQDPQIDFKLLVASSHLSKTYGYSVNEIERDQFPILCRLESLLDSDSKQSRLKTASIFLQNSIDIVAHFAPDLLIYCGDREDVLVGGMLSNYLEIPSIHFWGGDHTGDGHTDNPVRHAASKLSSVHFVSHEQHRNRLIKLGENDSRIFFVGSIALDRFQQHSAQTKKDIRNKFNIKTGFEEFALVIYHPVNQELDQYAQHYTNLFEALKRKNICAFISAPNTDPGNKEGLAVIDKYKDDPAFCYIKNLPRDIFLSIYKNAQFIIGNSSSGILEAASIPIPAINILPREQDRFAGHNVIYCDATLNGITAAIDKASSTDFIKSIERMQNPYGDGHSAQRAYQLIKEMNFKQYLYKKEDPLLL